MLYRGSENRIATLSALRRPLLGRDDPLSAFIRRR